MPTQAGPAGARVNGYTSGNCTWWVFQQAGWVLNGWGNAAEWLTNARSAGFQTSSRPQVGSVAVWGPGVDPPQGFGHVALVTATRPDGSFTVSEMNWKGLGVVDVRNVSDGANLQGFILPPGASPAAAASQQSTSGPDPFGLQQATASLLSAGQIGGGALLILAGLLVAVLLATKPGPLRAIL